jgi:octaprenyl-diphosphate synthase
VEARAITSGAEVDPSKARDVSPLAATIAGLQQDLRAIESRLAAAIGSYETRVEEAARHALLDGGKRVRPLLTCAVLRALGKEPAPFIDLVVAVEMAHAGSLLHDDVIDETQTRRGSLTGHVVFDVPTAVLAGDELVVLAVEQLSRRGPRELLVGLCAAVRALCAGESLERERRYDVTVGLEHARRVNRLKTASLFAYAAEAGAILARVAPHLRRAARSYGLALGEAFQTTDDRLDFCGDPEVMGKPVGQDLAAGVVTVPLAIALERSPALREQVAGVWRAQREDGGPARLARLRDRMKQLGALSATLRLAAADAARAAAAIRSLPSGPWRDRLAGLPRTIVGRGR